MQKELLSSVGKTQKVLEKCINLPHWRKPSEC